MLAATVPGLFVASTELADLLRAAGFSADISVVGLPFDRDEVRARAGPVVPICQRSRRIVFASRLDREKQPHLWLDLVEAAADRSELQGYELAILTGAAEPRSNEPGGLARIRGLTDARPL